MKKLVIGLSLLSPLTLTAETKLPTKQAYPINKELNKMQNKAFKKEVLASDSSKHEKNSSSEIMVIDPMTRANDFKQAYQFLKAQKAGSRVIFKLSNGQTLANVLDIDIMKGGSLVIFKLSSVKGMQFKVVRIEDITSIEHS